ncbi:MAG TPA: SAM-dependent chlorinase/fluorinase [Candidatus Saccharimonadales bacterium]|nr:SAM-dependent chlorinase/fluorinase [Candidatus Saccharimonadales bacterium]
MQTITLTTDFGIRDWFVGTMKGVVLGINPRAAIVDLTHEIPPGDIRAGAFALMAGYRYFPKGTVHVVVVDPGVGGRRRAIAVQTANYFFVGPDNGVLSWALAREKIKAIQQLENLKHFLKTISQTFHGRDIFAPVAAHLSRGLPLKQLGRELKNYARLPWPELARQRNEIRGEVVYIDRFGNAITNISAELIPKKRKITCETLGKRKVRCLLTSFYGAVPANSPVAVIGSSGFLEIAINLGSTAEKYRLEVGNPVTIRTG